MAKNEDRILGHAHEADGIEEYDNSLPNWWLGLFFVSVVFGVVYGLDYHFLHPRSSASEMADAIAERAAESPPPAVITGAAVASAADGKAVYQANCVACHGPELKGGVGPDLTDGTWIHGGTREEIVKTITNGVPEKGMLTWGPVLGPAKIAAVAEYVHGAGGGL